MKFTGYEDKPWVIADIPLPQGDSIELPLAPRHKDVHEYTRDDIKLLLKRRGGLENDTKRDRETDYEIAHSIGLRVFEFNEMIQSYAQGQGR